MDATWVSDGLISPPPSFSKVQRPKLQTIFNGESQPKASQDPAHTGSRRCNAWHSSSFKCLKFMASEGTVLCCTVLWTVDMCSYGILFELELKGRVKKPKISDFV